MTVARFRAFSRLVLLVTLGVIVFGAYVRASGSGAGCGSHWPTCNGEIIPRPKTMETVVELTHRATSGFISLLVAAQLVWALRIFPRRHRARVAAWCSAGFLVSEALVGAGLVLFEMVAHNASMARAVWICAHLLNTFLLLSSLTLTGFWATDLDGRGAREARTELAARGERAHIPMRRYPRVSGAVGAGLAGLVLVGATGAVTALGDTLFPARTLAAGMSSDFGPAAHLFERLRVLHPALAVLTAGLLLYIANIARAAAPTLEAYATSLARLVYLQLALGVINLWLLAPVITQLLHLLMADLLLIALVRLGAASLDPGGAHVGGAHAGGAHVGKPATFAAADPVAAVKPVGPPA